MSGAELVAVIGLAASIAQLIDTTKKVIDRLKHYKRGTTFEDVLPQLELFLEDVTRQAKDLLYIRVRMKHLLVHYHGCLVAATGR